MVQKWMSAYFIQAIYLLLCHDAGVEQTRSGENTAQSPDEHQDEAHLAAWCATLQRMYNGYISARMWREESEFRAE